MKLAAKVYIIHVMYRAQNIPRWLYGMFHQVSGRATLSSDCATALTTALQELAPACAVPITIGSMSDEPGD